MNDWGDFIEYVESTSNVYEMNFLGVPWYWHAMLHFCQGGHPSDRLKCSAKTRALRNEDFKKKWIQLLNSRYDHLVVIKAEQWIEDKGIFRNEVCNDVCDYLDSTGQSFLIVEIPAISERLDGVYLSSKYADRTLPYECIASSSNLPFSAIDSKAFISHFCRIVKSRFIGLEDSKWSLEVKRLKTSFLKLCDFVPGIFALQHLCRRVRCKVVWGDSSASLLAGFNESWSVVEMGYCGRTAGLLVRNPRVMEYHRSHFKLSNYYVLSGVSREPHGLSLVENILSHCEVPVGSDVSATTELTKVFAVLEKRDVVSDAPTVLFVIHGPNHLNGPNVWLLRILPSLREMGIGLRVLMFRSGDKECAIASRLRHLRIPVEEVAAGYTENSIQLILQKMNERPVDLFVPNLNVPSYFASKWLKDSGIPTVGIIHSDDVFHHELINQFASNGDYLTAVVPVSEKIESLLGAAGKSNVQIRRLPYGAPIPKKKASYMKGQRLRLIYVGRLVEEQKRITDTVRAMIRTLQVEDDVEAVIYGEGSARVKVEALIRGSGLGKRLVYGGELKVEELEAAYLRAHVFVLLSDYEGISIALMEAMGAGLVPVCTRIESGNSELIQHSVNGFLVENRAEAFVNAVKSLVGNFSKWEEMSDKARLVIANGFSSQGNAEGWVKLIKELTTANRVHRTVTVPALDVIRAALPPLTTNPKGIAREDRRLSVPGIGRQPELRKRAHHPFLSPSCEPNNADLFWVRSSILESVKAHRPLLSGTFLDVGCGVMPYRDLLLEKPSSIERYLGLDIETDVYRANVDLRWDGRTIPLENASVDCAMATEVLEHCPEPWVVLKEIQRVLKPGGVFFFTVPFIWPLHDAPWDFYRYTPFALEKFLGEAGFEDVDIQALGGWNASLAQMIGLWLKRAPMAPEERQRMVQQLWPFYRQLINSDTPPKDCRAGNTMSTGWRGVAFKAVDKQVAADTFTRDDLPVLLVRSHEFNYSETFIEDHVRHLSEKLQVLFGYPFPRFVKGGGAAFPESTMRVLEEANSRGLTLGGAAWDSYVEALAGYLRQSGVRVVLAESGLMGSYVYQACERAQIPYVVHCHGADAFVEGLLKVWREHYRGFFRTASRVVSVSQAMREQLLALGAPEARTVLAPYGVAIDLPTLAEPAAAPPQVLAVGRFTEKKAPLKTLEAFALARREVPEARLVMVGDGELLAKCREFVVAQGLEEAVTFAGVHSRRTVSHLMSLSRCFVQHSVRASNGDCEGLPLAVLEAGAHALPVVATRHAGIPDAVVEGEHGFLVDEGDVRGMADALVKLLRDGELAARMGRAFRLRVERHYSRSIAITRLQGILRESAEDPQPPVLRAQEPLSRAEIEARLREVLRAEEAFRLAEEAGRSGLGDLREEALGAALGLDRNHGPAYLALASCFVDKGQFEEAYICLKECERVGGLPDSSQAMLRTLEQSPELNTEVTRSYRSQIGMDGFGRCERPRRILVFTNILPPQEMGGYGKSVWELCDGLAQRGHTVRILCADAPYLAKTPEPGYERVERFVSRNLQLYGDWKQGAAHTMDDMEAIKRVVLHNYQSILQAVREFRPDICMAGNLDFLGSAHLDPILEQGIPIFHRLGNANPGYAVDATPTSPLYCIAGCSQWVNDQLQTNGFHPRNFAVLHPGSPLQEYYRVFFPRFDRLRICFAGLLMAYKGAHVLIKALGLLKQIGVPFSCELAGDTKDPQFLANLQQEIKRLGISDSVRLLGYCNRRELAAMYARSNVLVFPSVFEEPFGKVQVEAQAAGLAVVRSPVGGYRDMITDEVTGLLYKNEDAEDLARQLYVLHSDRELWEKLARQGQADSFRFATARSVENLERFLEKLIAFKG